MGSRKHDIDHFCKANTSSRLTATRSLFNHFNVDNVDICHKDFVQNQANLYITSRDSTFVGNQGKVLVKTQSQKTEMQKK